MKIRTKKSILLGMAGATAVLLSACGGEANTEGQSTPVVDGPAAPAAVPDASGSGLQRLRGEVVAGKDGYGLTPCGSDGQRIVTFAPDAQAFVDRFAGPDGHPAFFLDGWARERDGKLVVESVERAHTEGPRCDAALEDAVFVARGSEPFWSLSLTAVGWELQRPGEAAISATATPAKNGDGYAWESAAPAARVEIAPGQCADGMADAVSGWQAKLSLDGKTFIGCARRGALPLP